MSNEKPWFETKLDQDEAILLEKGVPKQFWGYILANGVPGTEEHDGLGAIYSKREQLVKSILKVQQNSDMGVTVIDGRDLKTIRRWIGGLDWTQAEERTWMDQMKSVSDSPLPGSIEEWEAQGPYTFEKFLGIVMENFNYNFPELLDRVAHKFPVDELDRVVGPRRYCSSAQYQRYCDATDGWAAIPNNGKFSDEQLQCLARHGQIGAPVDISVMLVDMNPERRLSVFKAMRDHHRDRSPKRK